MYTKQMHDRLSEMVLDGRMVRGKTYIALPSDTRGDGYDIGEKFRPDESGRYTIGDMECEVSACLWTRLGGTTRGVPLQYRVEVDPRPVYCPTVGQRVEVVSRHGRIYGSNPRMHRFSVSLAVRDEGTGRLIYRGHTPYWLGSTEEYASHYRTGLSRLDDARCDVEVERLERQARRCNASRWGGEMI